MLQSLSFVLLLGHLQSSSFVLLLGHLLWFGLVLEVGLCLGLWSGDVGMVVGIVVGNNQSFTMDFFNTYFEIKSLIL